MPLIGLGPDVMPNKISRAYSARLSHHIGYASNWAGPRSYTYTMIYLGPLQIGPAEIYGMPLNGLGQDGVQHDISGAPSARGWLRYTMCLYLGWAEIIDNRAPSAGVSQDVGCAFK